VTIQAQNHKMSVLMRDSGLKWTPPSGSSRKFCHRGYFVEAPEGAAGGTRASLPALVNPR
jgi:hypothetical protein